MPEDLDDAPEFSDEQMRVALRQMGRDARRKAFAAGRPVYIIKGESLVALHPDGTEEILQSLHQETEAGRTPE